MQDLQHLKGLGSPIEARTLEHNASAAMLRTAIWENATQGGIPWADMQQNHQQAIRHTEFTVRAARQAAWHQLHIASTIHQHVQDMKKRQIHKHNIRLQITRQAPLPLTKEDHYR